MYVCIYMYMYRYMSSDVHSITEQAWDSREAMHTAAGL